MADDFFGGSVPDALFGYGDWTPDQNLLSAAQAGDRSRFFYAVQQGADINYADPRSGFTALHYAAARQIRWLINALVKHDNLNYLAKDRKRRLPSVLAFEIAGNAVIGTLLMKREIKMARQRSMDYRDILTDKT
jgi:hypothetical protein